MMCGGRAWVLDDFKTLISYDPGAERRREERRVDKGHAALMRRVLDACRGERPFEPGIGAAYAAQSVALAALEAIATGDGVDVIQPARGPE